MTRVAIAVLFCALAFPAGAQQIPLQRQPDAQQREDTKRPQADPGDGTPADRSPAPAGQGSAEAQAGPENKQERKGPVARTLGGAEKRLHRFVEYLEAKDKFFVAFGTIIIAAFTVVLAISTIGLWRATKRLWEAGERQIEHFERTAEQQARDMQESLRIAKEAADAARLGANAALAGANHSREALIQTERAFVAVKRIIQNPVIDDAQEIIAWSIHPEWENKGNTPAREVRAWTRFKRFPDGLPEKFDYPGPVSPFRDSVIAIGPGSHSVTESTEINMDLLEWARQGGENTLLYWGRCTYRDVFEGSPERTTKFSVIIRVVSNPRSNQPLPLFFAATPGHNEAD